MNAGEFLNPNLSWSQIMDEVYLSEVIQPIDQDPRKSYDDTGRPLALGLEFDTIRSQIVAHGRADFSKSIRLTDGRVFTPEDRVLLYCYAYLRTHFWAAYTNFKLNESWLAPLIKGQKVVLIDVGCGPGTAGLAWAELFNLRKLTYVGIDLAQAMRKKADILLNGIVEKRAKQRGSLVKFVNGWNDLPRALPNNSLVILNFTFFFASTMLNNTGIKELAETILTMRAESANVRLFVSYTNSKHEEKNRKYFRFLRELGFVGSDRDFWNALPLKSVGYLNRPFHDEFPRRAEFVGELFELEQ